MFPETFRIEVMAVLCVKAAALTLIYRFNKTVFQTSGCASQHIRRQNSVQSAISTIPP
jgi:hypothetical protein